MERKILILIGALVLASIVIFSSLAVALFWTLSQSTESVAVIELRGVIDYEASLFGGSVITPTIARRLIDQALSDPSVKAVVLSINSPGGTMAAFEVYEIIRDLSQKKTVVAYISGYGTSGGYLISLPAKEIVAEPRALVGSVGAVATLMSYKGLLDKLGVNVTTITSGDLKDVGNPYREIEQRDIESVQKLIDHVARDFASKVMTHRGEKITNLREILRAGVYVGEEAVRLGLVDSLGTLDDAIKRARAIAGLPDSAPVRRISYQPGLLDILGLRSPIAKRDVMTLEILLMWPLPSSLSASVTSQLVRD